MKTPILLSLAAALLTACVSDEKTDQPAATDPGKTTSRKSTTSKPSAKPAEKAAEKPAAKATVGHVDATGAAKLLAEEKDVVVLDVRTPREFVAGHLKGAVNIDFQSSDFATKLKDLDRTKKYLIHCRSGGRSTNSLTTFQELGFQNLVHLDGGMMAWEKAGQPVEK